MKQEAAAAFIRANLPILPHPDFPSIRLHTAHAKSGLRRLTANATPYWAYAWPGGTALARFLIDRPGMAAGKQVLDFGCGGGVAGIAAARAGAASVRGFDIDPLARIAATLNAEANSVAIAVHAEPPLGVDLVLAGDVFYAPDVAERTVPLLRNYRQSGATVLVGDPGRRDLPSASLRELARYPVRDFAGLAATGFVYAFEP